MAWGVGGEAARDEAKVALGLVRMQFYKLQVAVEKVSHAEKGPYLRDQAQAAARAFDNIEKELRR